MNWSTEKIVGGSGVTYEHSVLRNQEGLIVACLYILPNGNLHADSWLCSKGWR